LHYASKIDRDFISMEKVHRNLCIDWEEKTHSIKQSYNCARLIFTNMICAMVLLKV
jgi:hypothetical protein